MIRRVNHTGRKRIEGQHAQINVSRDSNGRASFIVAFNLPELELPRGSPIYVEALRQTAFVRYDFGVVGTTRKTPADLPPELGGGKGVRFRIKVVSADGAKNGQPLPLLALADNVRPQLPDKGKGRSLLDVDWGDFRDQVWQLELDDQADPVLRISKHLVKNDFEPLVRSPEFLTLAMPAAFRQVLTHIIFVLDRLSSEDDEHWSASWLKLAGQWNGLNDPPDPEELIFLLLLTAQ